MFPITTETSRHRCSWRASVPALGGAAHQLKMKQLIGQAGDPAGWIQLRAFPHWKDEVYKPVQLRCSNVFFPREMLPAVPPSLVWAPPAELHPWHMLFPFIPPQFDDSMSLAILSPSHPSASAFHCLFLPPRQLCSCY